MKKYEHIPLECIAPYFISWKDILDAKEIGQIFTVPYADSQYRAYQFQDWLMKTHKIEVSILDLAAQMIDDEYSLLEYLNEQEQHTIIIAKSELLDSEGIYRLNSLETFNLTKQKGLLIFNEGFPSSLGIWKKKLPNSLVNNISILPMYDRKVMSQFLELMAKDWDMDISEEQSQYIFEYSGGNLWIAKSLLRSMRRDTGVSLKEIVQDPNMLWKAQQFWQALPSEHRKILLETKSDELLQEELTAFGFYIDSTQTLPGYLQRMVKDHRQITTVITSFEIQVNDQTLTHAFSKSERKLLAYFYKNTDVVISRDTVGEEYWGENWEEQYSDWALDKIISRLREKISQNDIPMSIETKRGQGYVSRRFF